MCHCEARSAEAILVGREMAMRLLRFARNDNKRGLFLWFDGGQPPMSVYFAAMKRSPQIVLALCFYDILVRVGVVRR